MSSLIVNNINSVNVQNLASQVARAWVNFNGSGTVAIRKAFNVASITDNGVGDFTANFTAPMPDTNYVMAGSARSIDTTGGYVTVRLADTKTVSGMRFGTIFGSGLADSSEVMATFFD